jgi:hypothetical protein
MKISRYFSLEAATQEMISQQLSELVNEMQSTQKRFAPLLQQLHDNFKLSGTNLIDYLVLRSNEIREAQEYLHHVGLSSLTNSESHTRFQYWVGWKETRRRTNRLLAILKRPQSFAPCTQKDCSVFIPYRSDRILW